ncbi:MAG TPA: hypothetical protein PLB30_06530 [Thermoleophilia bacterium]|nr:hypothetical protein [Thermoleophilia bacterium]HQG02986.1 hypothetical protein [Thermoleophilia bacterium]HQG54494.1 hypothetical protein [Thermoleophilia bacterium]HQJ98186.1 hypothetical protein [Thermoleophilia bacterium]
MSRNSASSSDRLIWSLTLRDLLLVAIVADLVVLAKSFMRIPLHVPGHSGVVIVALFVVGAGLIGRRGAATLIGLVAGVLAVVFGLGQVPLITWIKYLAMGVTVDVFLMLIPGALERRSALLVAGAFVNLGKLCSAVAVGLLLELPLGFLAWGLGYAATTHAAFGAVGGLLGFYLVRELRKVPLLAPRDDAGGADR